MFGGKDLYPALLRETDGDTSVHRYWTEAASSAWEEHPRQAIKPNVPGTGISGVPGAGDTPGTDTRPGSFPGRSGGSSRGGAVGSQVLLASQSPTSNRNRTSKYKRGHTKDEIDDLKHDVQSKGDPRAQPADTAPPGMARGSGEERDEL